jgi:hypothetical protein
LPSSLTSELGRMNGEKEGRREEKRGEERRGEERRGE